jgi:hypothetical protein
VIANLSSGGLFLQNAAVVFDLLSGIRPEQAQKVADLLNEYVLNVFVTLREKGAKREQQCHFSHKSGN